MCPGLTQDDDAAETFIRYLKAAFETGKLPTSDVDLKRGMLGWLADCQFKSRALGLCFRASGPVCGVSIMADTGKPLIVAFYSNLKIGNVPAAL